METKTNKTNEKSSTTCSQIALHISADPEYLCVVRLAVGQVGQVVGLKEDAGDLVVLAVDEALANIIKHSYDGPCNKPIIIKLNKLDNYSESKPALEIVIRDFGKQVDPESIKGRDLEDVRPGGLGVHIINSVIDEVKYSCADDCGMELRLIKYLT